MRTTMAIVIAGFGVLIALPAAGQGVVPQAPTQPPTVQIQPRPVAVEREARVVPPPLHYETSKPRDNEFYPGPSTFVEYDPAFIEPLAGKYQTASGSGRFGFSGWTAPQPPIGTQQTGWRDSNGWFALGFSITWDGPPAPKSRPPAR